MKTTVISKWPVWLKPIILNSSVKLQPFVHELKLMRAKLRDDIVPHMCMPDTAHGMDFAVRSMAIEKFTNTIASIPDDVEVVVFCAGISLTPGDALTEIDLVLSKYVLTDREAYSLYATIDYSEAEIVDASGDVTDGTDADNEPCWLTDATQRLLRHEPTSPSTLTIPEQSPNFPNETIARAPEATTLEAEVNSTTLEAEVNSTTLEAEVNSTTPALGGSITVPLSIHLEICTRFKNGEEIVAEIEGILPPQLLSSLAHQRVFVPVYGKKGIIFIGGTKKIPKVGNWVVNVDSYDAQIHTYEIINKNLRETTKNKRLGISSKGRVSKLNSLRRMRR
jgi:hypothetical protein